MKIKQWFMMILSLVISGCLSSLAAESAAEVTLPNDYSTAALNSWALQNSRKQIQYSCFISRGEVDYPSNPDTILLTREESDRGYTRLLKDLPSHVFHVMVPRPDLSTGGFYIFFYNPLGGLTMWGGQSYPLEQDKSGNWVLSQAARKIKLRLWDKIRVPVPVEGTIAGAQLRIRDSNGNVLAENQIGVGTTEGISWVELNQSQTDKTGELQIYSQGYTPDGQYFYKSVSFCWRSGEKLGTSVDSSVVDVGFEDITPHPDNDFYWYEYINTGKTNLGRGKLHKVTLTKPMTVYMYANTDMGEQSEKVHYRRIDEQSPDTGWKEAVIDGGVYQQTHEAGYYEFYYDWKYLEGPGPDYIQYVNQNDANG